MISNIFIRRNKNYNQLALLILRIVIGFGFMAHGWAKWSRGLGGFEKLLTQLHVPLPNLMAGISTATELFGGLALFIGAFVSLVSIPLICTMLVALFTVHIHYGYSTIKTIGLNAQGPIFGPPGYELNLLYTAGLVVLILMGAGRFSVDALLTRKKSA